jgi:hypothetical protein
MTWLTQALIVPAMTSELGVQRPPGAAADALINVIKLGVIKLGAMAHRKPRP